jgi:hypothetical protein
MVLWKQGVWTEGPHNVTSVRPIGCFQAHILDSWPDFTFIECFGDVCHRAPSMTGGRVCLAKGHSTCVCNMYVYVLFVSPFFLFSFFNYLFLILCTFLCIKALIYLQNFYIHVPPISPGTMQHIMGNS